jgi:hypothetical protein
MSKIADYFEQGRGPFSQFAGNLSRDTGKEDFVALEIHHQLYRQIEISLLQNSVTIRLLVASQGGGKTWTLSWLYRNFEGDLRNTLVLGIQRLELRGQPERGLMEAIFRALKPSIDKIRTNLRSEPLPKGLQGTTSEYVKEALSDPMIYSMLCGDGGRLPKIGNLTAPSMTKTEGTLQLLLGLFRVLYSIGFANVIVLIDEVESLFQVYGKRNLFIFENYLRGVFDEFQTDSERDNPELPRLVMILAGTIIVLEQISPSLVGKQTSASDVAQALVRRLSPTLLLVKNQDDVLLIASHRIGIHRKRTTNQPYIPYDKDAIIYVWQNSLGVIGDFCRTLQTMYELALSQKAQRITLEHAKKAIIEYQSQQLTGLAEVEAETKQSES